MSYVTNKFDDEVVRLVREGGVGLLPSDTIYGLSCQALDRGAVERLRRLKGRTHNKPFIILVSDVEMFDLLSVPRNQAKAAEGYWPGALSVIFHAPDAPAWLQRGTKSLALRLPARPQLRELIKKIGPIVSTSANLAGEPPLKSAAEAKQFFSDQLDFYVDIGKLDSLPSTLAMVERGRLKVVRPGAVKIE